METTQCHSALESIASTGGGKSGVAGGRHMMLKKGASFTSGRSLRALSAEGAGGFSPARPKHGKSYNLEEAAKRAAAYSKLNAENGGADSGSSTPSGEGGMRQVERALTHVMTVFGNSPWVLIDLTREEKIRDFLFDMLMDDERFLKRFNTLLELGRAVNVIAKAGHGIGGVDPSHMSNLTQVSTGRD